MFNPRFYAHSHEKTHLLRGKEEMLKRQQEVYTKEIKVTAAKLSGLVENARASSVKRWMPKDS